MTQDEIKEFCDMAYADIRNAEGVLKSLREVCKHPTTFEGDYSFRVGAIHRAIICYHCGKMIRYIDFNKQKLKSK